MKVKDVCNPAVITAQRHDSAVKLAELMREYHVGLLVVADSIGTKLMPIGLITDRDIVIEIVAKNLRPEDLTANDIMATELIMASVDDNIDEVILRMHQNKVRRLPVVDQQGLLYGIVALDDLLQLIVSELRALSEITQRQILKEADSRI